MFIKKRSRYYKVGQLLQKRPVNLRDTRTNGEPCLLTGQMWFENGVYMIQCPSDGSNLFRKMHIFARAHEINDAFTLKGYAILRTVQNI